MKKTEGEKRAEKFAIAGLGPNERIVFRKFSNDPDKLLKWLPRVVTGSPSETVIIFR